MNEKIHKKCTNQNEMQINNNLRCNDTDLHDGKSKSSWHELGEEKPIVTHHLSQHHQIERNAGGGGV